MRFRTPLALLILVCACACFADTPAPPQVAPPPQPKGIKLVWNIPYVPNGDPAEVLDLYVPETPTNKPLPVVAWIHGGGWKGGSKTGCPCRGLVGQGYAAASIEYRFSQKALFPAQIQDCQAAIRWLRANAQQYNLDPDNIGVWGASAGGHLVALLGTAGGKNAFPIVGGNVDQSDRVQAVCDDFGPADFNTVMSQAAAGTVKNVFNFNNGDPYSDLIGVHLDADKDKTNAVSPVNYVSKDNPPFLIMHGTADSLVPYAQSVELATDLNQVGVPVLLQPFPGAGHGGAVFGRPAPLMLVKSFFDKYLRHMDVPVTVLPDSEVTPPQQPAQ